MASFDFNELIKKIIKYLILGLSIAAVGLLVGRKKLNFEELTIISLTGAAVFSILDTFIPASGVTGRAAIGYGAGLGLMGGLPIA